MRLLIKIIGVAFVGSLVGRLILKGTSSPEGIEKVLTEVMPKVMDKAFVKLAPAKRREVLDRLHTMIAGLEEKYGDGTDHTEEPTA